MKQTSPRAQRSFALRFISGKYQGGEFPLPDEGEVVIGRSSELDMVLVEDMVSRRHAKITASNNEVWLQDLGSTNGSFVNGEKVKRAKLNEGDRILIGTSIIKVICTEGNNAASLSVAKAHLQDVAARPAASQVRTMTGSIAEVPLPDLLQLFGSSKKSGTLVVRTDHAVGKIHLDKGNVVYAAVNDRYEVSPLRSFYRIVTWEDGTFDMEPPEERQFQNPLSHNIEGLLMEAMRQIDEIRRLQPPPLTQALRVASPLTALLRDLGQQDLDVFQLVLNHRTVEDVLNASQTGDLETFTGLMNLLTQGYVQKS